MIGRTLSHFKITAKLGEGGMGEVYLALDTQLERKVALKVLPAELAQDPDRLKRLQREAKSLAALDHPHIVPIYSLEEADGFHFLTMAFIEGASLDRLIPEGGFSVARLVDLAVDLADALRAAHQQGIIHRDLKPANVMLDHEGRLRVLDFGLAKRDTGVDGELSQMPTRAASTQMTRAGAILGTFPYMSPEQAEGRIVDARSDLFSFGVMLYEMACGRRPFRGETGLSLITSILRDEPEPIAVVKSGLPAGLLEILDGCLEKDPGQRYQSAEELRDDLQRLQSQIAGGTAAPVPSPPVEPRTVIVPREAEPLSADMPTSRRGIWLAAVVVLITIAALAIWARWPRAEATRRLAVLPFENLMEEDAVEYLCDGVAESLARQISTLPEIRVAPMSATLHFKGQGVDPVEAGRQLDVANVVAGDLSVEGGRVYVNAKLVDVERSVELWSKTYDRDAGELLDVQDEIASAVLNDGLRLKLTADEQTELVRTLTQDGEAYDLFLQARYLQRRATEDEYLQAIELLRRATVRDPGFAGAYLLIAGIYQGMIIDGYLRPTDGWALANRYARQAVAIDPDLPDAMALRHSQAFFFDWDWEGAARERRRHLQLEVGEFDPELLRVYSYELLALGKPDEAVEMARRARELDPLSIGLAMLEADYLIHAGQPEAAIPLYERAIEVEPDNHEQYFGLAEALFRLGRFDEAIEARRQAHEVAGDEEMAALFATAQGEEGYRRADQAWVREQLLLLEARSAWAYVSPLDFARAYAQLGDADKAFEYLEQAFVDRAPGLVLLKFDPTWDNVRDDPRFAEALERVGLPSA